MATRQPKPKIDFSKVQLTPKVNSNRKPKSNPPKVKPVAPVLTGRALKKSKGM